MSRSNGVPNDIHDINLAGAGAGKIDWADESMPVLASIRRRFEVDRPLDGIRLGACLHVTTETANLARTLAAGGAEVFVCASNPLSTQDEVAASLVADYEIPVFARNGEDNDTYYGHIGTVLDAKPQITMDDGADLVSTIHSSRQELIPEIIGGTEETTTGVIRLRAMQKAGVLQYPIMAVNEADTKHFFDNRYGTGQSTIDGLMRATNLLLAGKNFVICGYGWCGRGLASRARGMGANVITTEIDATRALEALMDGFRVMPIAEAAEIGDIFVTVTGNKNVIDKQHFKTMKTGAVLANSGHFDVEINIAELERQSSSRRHIRPMLEEFLMPDDRKIYLLGEGRLINLASAEGHPASVMDMSFANQALAAEHIVKNADALENKVYPVPPDIDNQIARLKLDSLGISVDSLTEEQAAYMGAWQEGT